MEGETHNLQNDFFNAARKSKSPVTVFLGNGKKLTGRIKSFDKFTLLLDTYQGELIVFKHAISTVSAAARGGGNGGANGEGRSSQPPTGRQGSNRTPEQG
jgi:host factor-I protein